MSAFINLRLCRDDSSKQTLVETGLSKIQILMNSFKGEANDMTHHIITFKFELLCRGKLWADAEYLIETGTSDLPVLLWKSFMDVFTHFTPPADLKIAALKVTLME